MTREDKRGESRAELARKLDDLIDNAEDLLRSTASYGGAEIESARGRLKSQLQTLGRQGGRRRARLARQVRKVSVATRDYSREHAWQIWGALALAGLLTGLIIAQRQRRH